MRQLKGSSNYLKNQMRKNLAKAALSLLVFGALFLGIGYRVILTLQIGILEEIGLLLSLAPLILFYYYLRKYRIYSGGWTGEKHVAKLLNKTLNDDYYLINDLYLPDGGGDIDHIVLAPNGVFVLETKNWSGTITCNGDEWQRAGKRNFSGSPSRQVKRNAARIRQTIGNSSSLRQLDIWVEGIVVFTNRHAALRINNPAVPVLRLQQLPSHISAYRSSSQFSRQQLEAIGKEIIKKRA